MGGFDDEMLAAVDVRALLFGIVAPENEDEVLALFRKLLDDGIRKRFPTFALMRTSFVGPYCKSSVEEEHALLGPILERPALLR